MKHRLLLSAFSFLMLLAVVILVSTGQVSSQEPVTAQPGQSVGNVVPQAPDAPTILLFSYQGQLLNASGQPVTNPNLSMTFRLYTVSTGGTPCWSENRTVAVQNGLFNVLLGQITAINSTCLAGDAYLELVVSGETMSPRERLTSVVHSVEASTLPSGATTRGDLNVAGNSVVAGSNVLPGLGGTSKWILTGKKPESVMYGHNLVGGFGTTTQWDSDYVFTGLWDRGLNRKDAVIMWGDDHNDRLLFLAGAASEATPRQVMSLDRNGNAQVGNLIAGNVYGGGSQQIHMPAGDNIYMNWHSGSSVHFGGGNQLADVSITPTGIDLHGNSITNCGALIEANLQTPEEIQAGRIDRFEEGDVLCWSQDDGQLELCIQASNPLIMAVADVDGRPIVLGAELIKVIGPISVGDYLVASNVPGYAMARRTPTFGIVIAQALESFDGDQGLIKAMIRKM